MRGQCRDAAGEPVGHVAPSFTAARPGGVHRGASDPALDGGPSNPVSYSLGVTRLVEKPER
jgi:hypothetical protein